MNVSPQGGKNQLIKHIVEQELGKPEAEEDPVVLDTTNTCITNTQIQYESDTDTVAQVTQLILKLAEQQQERKGLGATRKRIAASRK